MTELRVERAEALNQAALTLYKVNMHDSFYDQPAKRLLIDQSVAWLDLARQLTPATPDKIAEALAPEHVVLARDVLERMLTEVATTLGSERGENAALYRIGNTLAAILDISFDAYVASDDEPEHTYDPGPEVDDEGGMSEYRHHLPGGDQ
jgi:hypothetical protein